MDRRRPGQIRFPVRVPVVAEPDAPAGYPTPGETQNLSRSGVLLRVERAERRGVPVRVTLPLRLHVSATLAGTVVWTQPQADRPGWEQGIQFHSEIPGALVLALTDATLPPRGTRPARGAAGVTAMHAQPIQGLLFGFVLGLALWMVAGLVSLRAVGCLASVPTSLWCVLGFLLTCTTVEVTRTFLRGRAAMVPSPHIHRRSVG